MPRNNKVIALDIGGSHVTASIVDISLTGKQHLIFLRKDLNSLGSAYHIIDTISECILEIMPGNESVDTIGIAFPGPFDYENGISTITNVGGKFQNTFGLHVKQALKVLTQLSRSSFFFSNDAHCFATGAYRRYQLASKRTVFLTLGTGFGSAFMMDGRLIVKHPVLPDSGAFYDQDFSGLKADDFFSSRWLLNEFQQKNGTLVTSVKEMAETNSDIAISIFHNFGSNLAAFLTPWLQQLACDELVIGGNISKAKHLFAPSLKTLLDKLSHKVNIIFTDDTEECILTGAAYIEDGEINRKSSDENALNIQRKIQSFISAPGFSTDPPGYNISLTSDESGQVIYTELDELAEKLIHEKVFILDGYNIIQWETLIEQLQRTIFLKDKTIFWYDISVCLRSHPEINDLKATDLPDFYDESKLAKISPDPTADVSVIYGTGAGMLNANWPRISLRTN